MSQKEDYSAQLPNMMAIPSNQVKIPTIPTDVAIQEAEDLYQTALKYKDELSSVGLTEATITQLTTRASALKEAQSLWQANYNTGQGAIKQWDELSPDGYALQRKLNLAFRYAYRNHSRILGRVREIADGSGDDDMIQDLNDYSVLGTENTAQLSAISFDLTQLDTAAELSKNLGTLLAQANGTKNSEHEYKNIRDRAFTLVKQSIDEIRECGKYVFADQPDIKKLFASDYARRHKTRNSPQPIEITQ